MVQEQVDPIPGVADTNPFLPGDERESGPHFQQEPFEMPDQGLFKLAFAVLVLEVEELQQVRVAQLVLDRHRVLGQGYLALSPAWPPGASSARSARRTGC